MPVHAGESGHFSCYQRAGHPGKHDPRSDGRALSTNALSSQKTGGRLFDFQLKPDASVEDTIRGPVFQAQIAGDNPLIASAMQFGEAGGRRGGLRSALVRHRTPIINTKTDRTIEARSSLLQSIRERRRISSASFRKTAHPI